MDKAERKTQRSFQCQQFMSARSLFYTTKGLLQCSRRLVKALHALSETQAVMYVTLQIESYFKSLA